MCSALFIEGTDLPSVAKECDKGVQLCNNVTDERLVPEAKKLQTEFENIKLKAEARIQKTNALELKE